MNILCIVFYKMWLKQFSYNNNNNNVQITIVIWKIQALFVMQDYDGWTLWLEYVTTKH